MFNTNISSTTELLSIAFATQGQTIRLYSGLAAHMQEHDNAAASAVYESLADEEREHERKLTEWAELEGLEIDPQAQPIKWEDPGVDTHFDVQAKNPYRCTPYKAFAFAVHHEERSFLYFTYVSADSRNPDVQRYANILARAELDRAASLRGQRRHAWHAESQHLSESRINPAVIQSVPDLLAVVVGVEEYLSRLFDTAMRGFPDLEPLATSARESLAVLEKMLDDSEPPGDRTTRALEKAASYVEGVLSETTGPTAALRRLITDCDRSFTFYDTVVNSTQDESIMLMAQRHSALATQRINKLRPFKPRE